MKKTPHTATTPEQHSYILEVFAALQAIFRTNRRGTPHHHHDCVQKAIYRVIANVERYQVSHPDPTHLARALATTATSDHFRDERIQNAQGARLVETADGRKVAARDLIAFEPDWAGFNKAYTGPYLADFSISDVAERIDARREIGRRMADVSELQRHMLILVDAQGYSVSEAAKSLKISREHASRTLAKARRATRGW